MPTRVGTRKNFIPPKWGAFLGASRSRTSLSPTALTPHPYAHRRSDEPTSARVQLAGRALRLSRKPRDTRASSASSQVPTPSSRAPRRHSQLHGSPVAPHATSLLCHSLIHIAANKAVLTVTAAAGSRDTALEFASSPTKLHCALHACSLRPILQRTVAFRDVFSSRVR